MLTLTDNAQDAVRTLMQDPQIPENAGLRIAPGSEGFELSVVGEPLPGDALIDDDGARVFVEPATAKLLDEQTLDAQLEKGGVSFFLATADAKAPTNGDASNDGGATQAPPVA